MILKINGVDMLPYVAYRGIKWQRSDLDGETAGRTLDGVMHRDRIASKIRLDITCRPLRAAEASTVLNGVLPEYVSVEYSDPMEGKVVTKEMYSNNNPATHMLIQDDGTEWWDGIVFPLIER